MRIFLLLSLFLVCFIKLNAQEKSTFNVRDYGAVGDGKTLDSPAINKAIEAAAKAGGGTVLVPAGTYLSGCVWYCCKKKHHHSLFTCI